MSKTWESLRRVDRSPVLGVHPAKDSDLLAAADHEDRPVRPHPVSKVPPREEPFNEGGLNLSGLGTVEATDFARLVCHTNPTGPGADRFRLLRMRLRNLRAVGTLKTLLITSPLPQDGKTTVSLNLATTLAEQGAKRILVIDCDLHRRSASEQLGLPTSDGVAECLQGTAEPLSVIRRVEPLGWYLLFAGRCEIENPTELLRAPDVSGLLATVAPFFDWVILDSPPVLPLTDSLALAQVVDGTLLVARAEQTPTKAVEEAIALLGRKEILGIVLNAMEGSSHPYSKYYNYYRSKK